MTKAVVRAMDTTIDFMAKKKTNITIDTFIVSGASKWGLTCWATAAVDKRIIGAIPIEFTILSTNTNLKHYISSLGGVPIAMQDYYDAGLFDYFDSPEMKATETFLDP